jgi:hypothetical protein
MGERGFVELGFRGVADCDQACAELCARLSGWGLRYERV